MAYAAAKFAESCLKAIQGEPGVVECAYVSSHLTDLPFFASPLRLDQNGIAVCIHAYSLSAKGTTTSVGCTIANPACAALDNEYCGVVVLFAPIPAT